MFIAASMTFTSCINVLEEMFLNKDGSGKYAMTIDMSAIMDASTREMLKSFSQEEDAGEDAQAEEENAFPTEVDTTMYFRDMPADMRGALSRPDFYDKVSMKMVASESKEIMKITFQLDFDNADDIDYFLKNMDKLMSSAGDQDNPLGAMGGGGEGMGGLIPSAGIDYRLFDISSKLLKRHKAPAPAENAEEDESMAMMKMFMAGAEYTTVYHFPGKVKKATNPNAKIDGNTVTIKGDLLEMMEGKADMSTEVKFKKK